MADAFLRLPAADRREVLSVAADRSGRPAHLLEKDAWVVWALAALYGSPLGERLVFKGGTSLSKAYGVIRRFSEDVDLTYDIRALAPDLVGDNGDCLPKNRSEEKRWSSEVRKRLPEWVAGTVQPVVAEALASGPLAAAIRVENDKLFIDYEATTTGSGYVAPIVMLEFGARSTGEPASFRDVVCDAAGLVDGVDFPSARPRVMHAERTFWEKATAIHVFCLQERLVAIASRGTGMTLRASTKRASRPRPLPIVNWRTPSLDTRRCSSRRKLPIARRSVTQPRSTAVCNWSRLATVQRH